MSQFPPHASMDPQRADSDIVPKTSGIATAAFVSSLIFCCPLTSFIGIIMGAIAFIHVGMDPVMRRGKGLAATAVVIGIIGLAVQGFGWVKLEPFIQRMVDMVQFTVNGPRDFVAAIEQGDFTTARSLLDSDVEPTISDDDLALLQDLITNRHGACQSWQVQTQQQGVPVGGGIQAAQTMQMTGTMQFANGPCQASFTFAIKETGGPDLLAFGITNLTIFDPVNGDIVFPFTEDSTPTPEDAGEENGDGG